MAEELEGQDNQTDKSALAQTDKTATTTATDKAATTTKADATTTAATDKTLATGGTTTETVKPVWPDDWRERMAAQVGGTDQKAVAKELKRLGRMTDPTAVYGSFRELDSKFSEGGLIKKPGKDAKPEEIAAFNKALGVPDTPEDLIKAVKLADGKVLGDNDRPLAEAFAKVAQAKGYTPDQYSTAVDFLLTQQEVAAIQQYNDDKAFRAESETGLKQEFGPSYEASIKSISGVFVSAPGGANPDDEGSLMGRLLGGRTTDGRIIGDDPVITKWLASLALEINPAATIIPSGSGETAQSRLEEIRKLRRTDPDKYNADKKMQEEEVKLIDIELRTKNRGAKAA